VRPPVGSAGRGRAAHARRGEPTAGRVGGRGLRRPRRRRSLGGWRDAGAGIHVVRLPRSWAAERAVSGPAGGRALANVSGGRADRGSGRQRRGVHLISSTPARTFAARASVNRRSESRLSTTNAWGLTS